METPRRGRPSTLPARLHYQIVYTLTDLLPPPLDDSPEALRARNHAAIAKVAALLPVNANEAGNVSLNGTHSHEVAFETVLSQPPLNRASEGSGARILDRVLRRGSVEPGLADRDFAADGRESRGRAN